MGVVTVVIPLLSQSLYPMVAHTVCRVVQDGFHLSLKVKLDEDTWLDSAVCETTWVCTYVRLRGDGEAVVVPPGAVIVAASEIRYDSAAPTYKVALAVVDGENVEMVGEFAWGGVSGTAVITDQLCHGND